MRSPLVSEHALKLLYLQLPYKFHHYVVQQLVVCQWAGRIDLVMRMEHCDRTFAVRRLAEMRNGGRLVVPSGQQAPRLACRQAPALKVVSSSYISDCTLLRYASGRGISEDVLCMYCREVAVRMGRSGSARSYIEFPNNGDVHVLRSAVSGPGGKRCTNSAPTYLAPDGMITAGPTEWAVAVFEGFFDFPPSSRGDAPRTEPCPAATSAS